MSNKALRNWLIGLELFVGLMAVYGGVRLLIDAAGFGVRVEWLRGSPFSNYQIPGIALLVGVGGSSLLAAAVLMRARDSAGAMISAVAGLILMVFEIVETASFGLRSFQQPLMFVIGAVVTVLGAVLWRRSSDRAPARKSPTEHQPPISA